MTFRTLLRSLPLLILLAALPLPAQSGYPSSTSPQGTTGQSSPGARRGGRQQPCWQQAGISQAAVEKRRQIEESTRSQVEAVCADSSLSMQQKQAKLRQIHQQAKAEREALITPQQEQAVEACRQQRGEGRAHGGGGGHRGGEGPCGEMPGAGNGTGGRAGGNNRTAGSGQAGQGTGRPNPSTQQEPEDDEDPR